MNLTLSVFTIMNNKQNLSTTWKPKEVMDAFISWIMGILECMPKLIKVYTLIICSFYIIIRP